MHAWSRFWHAARNENRGGGSPDTRVLEGYSNQEDPEFLGADPSPVRRWLAAFRRQGAGGLVARRIPGSPRKLISTQEKIALCG